MLSLLLSTLTLTSIIRIAHQHFIPLKNDIKVEVIELHQVEQPAASAGLENDDHQIDYCQYVKEYPLFYWKRPVDLEVLLQKLSNSHIELPKSLTGDKKESGHLNRGRQNMNDAISRNIFHRNKIHTSKRAWLPSFINDKNGKKKHRKDEVGLWGKRSHTH